MPRTRPAVTLPTTVEKVIHTSYSGEPEKAEIAVEGADPLYREIRIENTLQDSQGNKVGLKPGAQVEVTIEADPEETAPKNPAQSGATRDEEDEAEAETGNGRGSR